MNHSRLPLVFGLVGAVVFVVMLLLGASLLRWQKPRMPKPPTVAPLLSPPTPVARPVAPVRTPAASTTAAATQPPPAVPSPVPSPTNPPDARDSLPARIAGVAPLGEGGAVILLAPQATSRPGETPPTGPAEKVLPIYIGLAEATAIQLELQGVRPPRPMTHDLLLNLVRELGGTLERITVTELKDGTYYALLRVRLADGSRKYVDARPSDSLALAVRTKVPIYVSRAVFAAAGEAPGGTPAVETATPSPGPFF